MKRRIAVVFIVLFVFHAALWAGLGSNKTMYVGGTVNSIKEGTEGTSSSKDEKVFVFEYSTGKHEVGRFTIPYDRVNDLEYGQKAGRRLGLAIAVTPWALLSTACFINRFSLTSATYA